MENLLMGDINIIGPSDGKTLFFPLIIIYNLYHALTCMLTYVLTCRTDRTVSCLWTSFILQIFSHTILMT